MIFKILNTLLKCRFNLNAPKNSDLVVLDDEGIEYLKYILKNRKYFTLVTRSSNLKNIYFSPKVLFFTFISFKGDLFLAYLSALIHVIKPKIVITYVDNSSKFHNLAQLFKDKIKFLAIQNSTRDLEIKINEYVEKKNLYSVGYKQNYFVPYLFCYGQYEIDFCKKKKLKLKISKK